MMSGTLYSVAAVVLLAACQDPPKPGVYEVARHDDCIVYCAITAHYHYVYYTKCGPGSSVTTQAEECHLVGRTTVCDPVVVSTDSK